MTEQEWLACDDPQTMAFFLKTGIIVLVDQLPSAEQQAALRNFLIGTSYLRKLRLCGLACCRMVWDILPDDRSRAAVIVAERFLDGDATEEELASARVAAQESYYATQRRRIKKQGIDQYVSRAAAYGAWAAVCFDVERALWDLADVGKWVCIKAANRLALASPNGVIRDIFGNPFRPLAYSHIPRLPEVCYFARSIHYERAFDRMLILADALEDAGCDNADILNHCRQPGEHVRGCWVVDLILGKV